MAFISKNPLSADMNIKQINSGASSIPADRMGLK
jgi:hypothetical protein